MWYFPRLWPKSARILVWKIPFTTTTNLKLGRVDAICAQQCLPRSILIPLRPLYMAMWILKAILCCQLSFLIRMTCIVELVETSPDPFGTTIKSTSEFCSIFHYDLILLQGPSQLSGVFSSPLKIEKSS